MTPQPTRRRLIAAMGLALALSACAQPKLTGAVSADLSIKEIAVRTEGLERAVKGRPNDITREKLAADLTGLLRQRIANRPGAVAADLMVDVISVNLIARGASALAPLQSTSKVSISVIEQETGRVIVTPTEFTAFSSQLRMGGFIGAATAPTVENDYIQTLTGLTNAIEKRLYGEPT